MRTSYQTVEEAIRRLPGVAAASVGTGSVPGKGRLSIRLTAGHDAKAVAVAVSELLRGRFGIQIDPEQIKPRPEVDPDDVGPAPDDDVPDAQAASPAGNGHAARGREHPRAAIRDLVLGVEGLEVSALAVLDLEGRQIRGTATGAATTGASMRAVARATLDAVDHLVPGHAKTDLEMVELSGAGEPRQVTVQVIYLTHEGEERLAGVSLVRDGDVDAAVMRATLDAVNRRVARLLGAQPGG